MICYDVASNVWQALIEGGTRVSHNVAPLGGGVYLLGEKARLDAGVDAGAQAGPCRSSPRAWYLNLKSVSIFHEAAPRPMDILYPGCRCTFGSDSHVELNRDAVCDPAARLSSRTTSPGLTLTSPLGAPWASGRTSARTAPAVLNSLAVRTETEL
jgi:hypothetical protein